MTQAACSNIDEIVAKVLEAIGKKAQEVFLPRYLPNRIKDISWADFIAFTVLENDIKAVYKYCGYSSSGNYAEGIKRKHFDIVTLKGNQPWRYYFLLLVSKKYCSSCNTIKSSESFSRKKGRIDGLRCSCKECDAKYLDSNKDHYRQYYEDNKARISERGMKYRVLNKLKRAEYDKQYRLSNRHKRNAQVAKRKATKLQATPKWANLVAIEEIYRTCPEGYHVDHIVPLQNPLVCGLHCEFNLQHLHASENLSKGNRFII
jgi:hypothetical protein